MSGIGQLLVAGASLPPQTTVITTSGAGSITSPVGYTSVTVEAIGGGGQGFGSNTTNQRAGGGGGTYAISNARIAITGGTTIVYYQVGPANGGATTSRSWVNVGTNAAPASAAVGCLAPGGTNAASGVAGTGATTGFVGATARAGGTGTTGNNSVGGGGSGASTAATGQTAGTDTTGLSVLLMGGGTGGAYNNATTSPGTAPGGAGGGAATTGTNYTGAIGRVRITFYA